MEEQKRPDTSMIAITDLAARQISRIAEDCTDNKKSVSEGAIEALQVAVTVQSAEDEKFRDNLKSAKQEEIKSTFEADKLTSQAKKLNAKQLKREAFYTQFRPIFEFDLSDLTGIKPKKIEDEENKTKSFSVPLMILVLIYSSVIYFLFRFGFYIIKGISMTVDFVQSIGGKTAKAVWWLFIIGIILLVVFIIVTWVQNTFGLSII